MNKTPFYRLLRRVRTVMAVVLFLAAALPTFAAGDNYTEKLTQKGLLWVGNTPPSQAESKQLWEAFGTGNDNILSNAVGGIEAFIKAHPNSPWVPSLEANMGIYYRQNGYFTPALENWELAWKATHKMTDRGKMVADYTLVNWLQLLSSLGRTETMKALFEETKNRPVSGHWSEYYWKSHAAYDMMLAHPEISYRCGTYALDAVAQVLRGKIYFKQIWEQPSPPTGFTMADLLAISDSNHLDIVAVQRTGGYELVVPSVVHWKQNHYAAIIDRRGDMYKVVDPTFRMGRWLKSGAINSESSGEFLVPADHMPQGWKILSQEKAASIFGKGYPGTWYPDPTGPDGSGSGGNGGGDSGGSDSGGGSCSCTGMPNWTIMEPWCTPWIVDQPLQYRPSKGPEISLKLFYWSEGNYYWKYIFPSQYGDGNFFNLGDNWTCSWMNFAVPNDSEYPAPDGSVVVYASGGALLYTNLDGTAPQFSTRNRMITETNAVGDTIGYAVLHSSGAEEIYTNEQQIGLFTFTPAFFLSRQIAPDGNSTAFLYTNDAYGDIDLEFVIDGDGNTNWLVYTNVTTSYAAGVYGLTNYNMISEIHDPFGHVVHLDYGICDQDVAETQPPGDGLLTNVTDVVGISTVFEYSTNSAAGEDESITNMVTPYGATGFYGNVHNGNTFTVVTEPNGSHEMFFEVPGGDDSTPANYSLAIPKVYTDSRYVPTRRPADNLMAGNTLDNPDWNNPTADDKMDWDNSFYWNRQQFANLSATFLATGVTNWDISQLTTNDYFLPRMRHFSITWDDGIFNCLSMERDPGPDDGRTLGEMTWYDYPGKPDFYVQGISATPILKIKVLPDGTEWYQINQLDQWNNATNVITTYSVNGTVLTRTNSYVYATNGQDMLQETRANGVISATYGYDTNHQVLFMTNALGEVTSYLYNTNEQQVSTTQPNGQVTTNAYGSDGHLAEQIVLGISTNYNIWSNDLVYTHTDERGLTQTNSYDALNRLTNVLYPDGTSVSYIYSNLDMIKMIDRMGHLTAYAYDAIREKTSQTDANNHTTYYGYCSCGALYSITDALNDVTYFIHDNQGNLIQTLYPDGYSVSNSYNLLRQLVSRTDSSGMAVNKWYDNQGLLVTSSNNVGPINRTSYDIEDRATNTTDADNVSVTTTYDNLDRPVTHSYPDGGIEKYAYTPNITEKTSYTNQIGEVWLYGYDGVGRKTNEVCVGVTTNGLAYGCAGDLLSLTDGNGNTTTWGYDKYGRVTNKLDAAQNTIFKYGYDDDDRMTNRWTPAKGTTVYGYDPVGNLTGVKYQDSRSISLSYDADNHLTSMVDAVGTTAYSYDSAGQVLSEGGLWPDDTVNYTYQNRLRKELSLAHPVGSPWIEDYGYDDARRLIGAESPAGTFDYAYDPVKLQRVDELSLPNGAYITNAFDSMARLLSTALVNSNGADLDSQSYAYNTAGQRTSETNEPGDYRNYSYDNEGELVAAVGKESGGANRLQEQLGYAYDPAGNLNFRTNNALIQRFNVNDLNELTRATNHGTLTVAGTTTIPATSVKVNGLSASRYADGTFALGGFAPTTGPNTYAAIGEDSSGNFSTNSVTVNVIGTNVYGYDLNGNLTNDSYRSFAYDDENELIAVWLTNAWSNSFAYDGKMRRRIERDYSWQAGTWTETNETHFIYDGNVVIEERNASNIPLVSYTRGNDLSDSLQGAGGIGGLLARTTYGQELPGAPTTAFYHADGNGNITVLMYPNGQLAAKYLFDPFGNTLAMSGPLRNFNKYRFSSKEWEDNAGLYYYGYRFYDPGLQRWVNRDPINDINFSPIKNTKNRNGLAGTPLECYKPLYNFAWNDSVCGVDPFGLDVYKVELESTESTSVDHREIVGDDGKGGCYILEFYPDPNACHFSIWPGVVLVGGGKVDVFRDSTESAADYISNNGETIMDTVETDDVYFYPGDQSVDSDLSIDADQYANGNAPVYFLLFNDCGSFANSWLHRAREVVHEAEDSIPDYQ